MYACWCFLLFFFLFIFVEPGFALFCVATCDCASEEFVSVVKCNVVCQFVFASFTFNLVGFVCFGSNQLNTFLGILTADKLLAFFFLAASICVGLCVCVAVKQQVTRSHCFVMAMENK